MQTKIIIFLLFLLCIVGTANASLPVFDDNQSPALSASNLNQIVSSFNDKSLNVKDYGAIGDGITDDTSAFQVAINASMEKGMPICIPSGTYLIMGQIIIPNDGATTNPIQRPLTLLGDGFSNSCIYGGGAFSYGGSVLDMRYSGQHGKIVTTGFGLLNIEGITFLDSGEDSTPWIYTTCTTLHIIGNAFIGSKSSQLCDQDAIVLGGTIQSQGGISGMENGFQGYGTVIEKNFFNHIRRAVYGRTFCNGVIIRDNSIWGGSGTNLIDGSAIEINNPASNPYEFPEGNIIENNIIELLSYNYGIKVGNGIHNTINGNDIFDAPGIFNNTSQAAVYFGNGANKNTLIAGCYSTNIPLYVTYGPNTNTIIDSSKGAMETQSYLFSSGNGIYTGIGNPNGNITASVGSIYLNQLGGSGTTLYVKESGAGNIGWIAK